MSMLAALGRRAATLRHVPTRATDGVPSAASWVAARGMGTADIRASFVSFFERHGHHHEPSAQLIPKGDQSLLFTNAGMVPFKNRFLRAHEDDHPHRRVTSVQRCVRAGGKHNDLENVGFTARHHTLFEMMGNFSFADYGKEEAIRFAWEYVTCELALPAEKLAVSVHHTDDESAQLWKKVAGVPDERIMRLGDEDNFWSMGDTGPCGPCSEIFYDLGEPVDGERWLEVWNLVFMSAERTAHGKTVPLPALSVDTGAGLERVASVLQGVRSNYDTDLFTTLITAVRELAAARSGRAPRYTPTHIDAAPSDETSALRVIADHVRSSAFLLMDGVVPSNVGRGYVLRRIVRRAVRHGHTLGLREPFMGDLVPVLAQEMGEAYPDLAARCDAIAAMLRAEERIFFGTLDRGTAVLAEALSGMAAGGELRAETAFYLYDTCGFPLDLTVLVAREHNVSVDTRGFDALMEQQRTRARAAWKGADGAAGGGEGAPCPPSVRAWDAQGITPRFTGHAHLREEGARVVAVERDDAHDVTYVSVECSPMYAMGGGQVGDRGTLTLPGGDEARVVDTVRPYDSANVLVLAGAEHGVRVGDAVAVQVDAAHRAGTAAHHTATHMLHAALRRVLGEESGVQQAGSEVSPHRLRFDFTHATPLTPAQLRAVEDDVRHVITSDVSVHATEQSYDDAVASGATSLFSDKYGDTVRVVRIGEGAVESSAELCGGTHVARSGDVVTFKITAETGVAAGTRRIEAVAGPAALAWLHGASDTLDRVAAQLSVPRDGVEERVQRLQGEWRTARKDLERARSAAAAERATSGASGGGGSDASSRVVRAADGLDVHVHVVGVDGDGKALRAQANALRKHAPSRVHVVVDSASGRLACGVDTDALPTAHAGTVVRRVTRVLGGGGGGQAAYAEGKLRSGDAALSALCDAAASE